MVNAATNRHLPPHSLHPNHPFPQSKMALENSSSISNRNNNNDMSTSDDLPQAHSGAAAARDEKSTSADIDRASDSSGPTRHRSRGSRLSRFYGGYGVEKVGGRIAPVLPHLRTPAMVRSGDVEVASGSGSDSGSDILGHQIDFEKNNVLQYRTCSWQKVSFIFVVYSWSVGLELYPQKRDILLRIERN